MLKLFMIRKLSVEVIPDTVESVWLRNLIKPPFASIQTSAMMS